MKQALMVVGIVGLLGVQSAGAWTLERHDCNSVASWSQTNAQTLGLFAQSLVPIFTAQDQLIPNAKIMTNFDYVGIGVGLLKGFVQLGGSPLGALNIPLHLVCLDLEP